jgi:hypothetical protein
MTPDDLEPNEQLDAIEELTRSDGYRLVAQRMEFVVGQKQVALESEYMVTRPDDANYTRGMIAGVKLCLDLPVRMHTEIHDEIKEKTRKVR